MNFQNDYQSILDRERLVAEKRLMDQQIENETYEDTIVYNHDMAPAETTDRYGLTDMRF